MQGFLLYESSRDKNVIIFCALGSVLPDIVDKPLGHIFLNSVLDNGKIFFHSLVIFLLFLMTGILVWKYFRSGSFLVVAQGILIHQTVDLMWNRPVNWYYPFLGQYQVESHRDYILSVITGELTSVTEWIFFIGILVISITAGIHWYQKEPAVLPDPLHQKQRHQLYTGAAGCCAFRPAAVCRDHIFLATIPGHDPLITGTVSKPQREFRLLRSNRQKK